ncbi:MAG: peptide chain release factor N(5)-glutamine methyltransferase [Myxococcales bacterium]|nr:peptide chain release factor N(5)-glutamine methyltransferase [Myxococcales bacterium]
MSTWTTLAVLDWTTKRFQDAQVSAARLEAQVLLAHALSCKRIELYTNFDRPMSEAELASYRGLIRRRLAGEPLAYLVGEHEFWSLPFWITPHVLVPRPDTETLIEVVLARGGAVTTKPGQGRVLDLCTGSGAIAVSLLHELPELTGVATDLSPEAVAVAVRNAERNGVSARLEVRQGDLWAPVAGEQFDLVVSNPPYVASEVIPTLSAEVRAEPRMALDGGPDGLAFYRRIIAEASGHLRSGGLLALEHGFDQADAVAAALRAAGLADVETVADLGKNPRVTLGRWQP